MYDFVPFIPKFSASSHWSGHLYISRGFSGCIDWDGSWLRVEFGSLGVDIGLFDVVDGFDGFGSETGHGWSMVVVR